MKGIRKIQQEQVFLVTGREHKVRWKK